jgi:hypothetical protein
LTAGDPRLGRLRTLLRLQAEAARQGSWAALHALGVAVQAELERQRGTAADPAALAEVAHLQLRLVQDLEAQVRAAQARLRSLEAQRAYTALAEARPGPDPTA